MYLRVFSKLSRLVGFEWNIMAFGCIARRLFLRESNLDIAALEDVHYAYRICDRLHRALVPLRRALQIPEVYMSVGQWDSLPYSRVPSVARKNYKDIFEQHDET
ncbi:hypothetical protein IEQ34_015434 [Dendrobium chrysotoxum]|uniref:DUF2828 domain-containing protein n=1 Tax=Dendrobium chrysotoxum TaxID=161865 RepID=A0AAV7GIS6_DENCH|nr:hypothetical protein IEQ34_015434 [Dendrobium chrysotoxum]